MSHAVFESPELPRWPAPERNKGPILEALRDILPHSARVLEIASGTGQHAAWFAHHAPGWDWHPSDPDPDNRAAVSAWVRALSAANLHAPVALDTRQPQWPEGPFDAVYCANMVHIAPWSATEALLRGAEQVLQPGGWLLLYGPWRVRGVHTSESNVRFDASLRERDPAWGVRDITDLEAALKDRALRLESMRAMSANNHVVVIRRT